LDGPVACGYEGHSAEGSRRQDLSRRPLRRGLTTAGPFWVAAASPAEVAVMEVASLLRTAPAVEGHVEAPVAARLKHNAADAEGLRTERDLRPRCCCLSKTRAALYYCC